MLSLEHRFPLPYLRPSFHMAPIDNQVWEENHLILKKNKIKKINFKKINSGKGYFVFSKNAREAIFLSLKHLNLAREEEVWIVTTSKGRYISGCVTREIEKFGRWSLSYSNRTKVIFVIHEFGFPYPAMEDLKKYGLPIIEDCAYALGSHFENGLPVGSYGDFCVYSFSKSFPVPYGGLLFSRQKILGRSELSKLGLSQLKKLVGFYLPKLSGFNKKRVELFKRYQKYFSGLGLSSRFSFHAGVIPTSFVIQENNESRAQKIKDYLNERGIESSVFYGSGGYFLPLHYRLGPSAITYIEQNVQRAFSEFQ